ncbi:SAF domain-containing protein [Nocardioides massiliensis]|uniref:SAF domain-containing protein n=1 Tax=Nocardioides massiliensis TaxID=1325935 RepID=A0ABT9NJR7_9ACTN|nr:hypothetical protein [Nocardioides massiliensis]MDP9820660.1 hypothetical protein [Nocardioides massiliensis]
MTQDGAAATATGGSTGGSSKDDRQRQRAARGIRSRAAASGPTDRPTPPRRRRPALAALAVLLIVGGAALAGLLALRLDSREYVLVVGQDMAIGQEFTTDNLLRKRVASEGDMLIREADADQVIGAYARSALRAGQFLDETMVDRNPPVPDDLVQVGIPLVSTNVPPGLRAGDEVRLIRVGETSVAAEPLATGLVTATDTAGGGDDIAGGSAARLATIVVPADAADGVVDAAATNRLGVALIGRGASLEDVTLTILESSS